ncbi:MAG: dihydrofolate reductase family protein [Bacteriovoracia bacterium]
MTMAINAAEKFHGATTPLPPAGAIALDKGGKVLLGAALQSAESPSAEAKLLDLAQKLGKLATIETLVCTLEPEAELILKHKNIRRVVLGAKNPKGGTAIEKLRKAGVEILEGTVQQECEFLIRAFTKFQRTGKPYVTLKGAFTTEGAQKALSSKPSLIFSHELRRRCDAIWTSSGTVLAEKPDLSVSWVPDHPQKKRQLVLSDRRRRIPPEWIARTKASGFTAPHFAESLEQGLEFLGKKNVLEVLVEAGPTLRDAWLESGLWDESVVFLQGEGDADDEIDIQFRHETGED